MTKKILIDEAVVKQVLEALEYHPGNYKLSKAECVKYNAVEATLREALEVNNKGVNALAEQQSVEPVADEQRDAARYRWLRENRATLLITGFFGNGCINRAIDEVDKAIDRAIKAAHSITGSKT